MKMKNIILMLMVSANLAVARGQQIPVTLNIGDTAPPLIYSAWVQGIPFALDQKDMIYVVEFWATWCGPCKQVMPHLSQLSQKYANEAKFIGVNIWERTGGEPYESVIPKVSQFVEANKAQMTYNVLIDNNDQHMGNNWMRAAGQNGIPATFIIQNNKIVWIGHPMRLDGVLPDIIAGSFDIEKSKEQIHKAQELARANREMLAEFRKQINDAVEAEDFDQAFKLIDEGIAKSPRLAFTGRMEKMDILLQHFSDKEAMEYVNGVVENQKSFGPSVAMALAMRNGLSLEIYSFAATLVDRALESNTNSVLYNLKADVLIKADRKAEAADALGTAIAAAKKELDDPNFAGRVSEKTVQQYQTKLDNLRK